MFDNVIKKFISCVFDDHDDMLLRLYNIVSTLVTFSRIAQFDDMWMPEKFQILNFPFNTIIGISTQLCPIDELQGDELSSLLMFSDFFVSHVIQVGELRLTFPNEPSPRVLKIR
jgi:hypothetical protein